MKSKPLSVLSAVLMILAQSAFAQEPPADPPQKDAPAETKTQPSAEQPIDFNRARQLLQKKRNGQDLSADEEAYLQRAQEARRRQQGRPNNPRQQPGFGKARDPRHRDSKADPTIRGSNRLATTGSCRRERKPALSRSMK